MFSVAKLSTFRIRYIRTHHLIQRFSIQYHTIDMASADERGEKKSLDIGSCHERWHFVDRYEMSLLGAWTRIIYTHAMRERR